MRICEHGDMHSKSEELFCICLLCLMLAFLLCPKPIILRISRRASHNAERYSTIFASKMKRKEDGREESGLIGYKSFLQKTANQTVQEKATEGTTPDHTEVCTVSFDMGLKL